MTKEESENFVAKLFELTPKNVIRNMRITKSLHVKKDGEFYSSMANKYVAKMNKYSKFCKEEEQENWIKGIQYVISYAGEVMDYVLIDELYSYQNASEIMELLNSNKDWNEVKKTVQIQGHTGATISSLGQKLLRFSPYGVEFVENVIGINALSLLTALNNAYEEQKCKDAQLVLSKKTK